MADVQTTVAEDLGRLRAAPTLPDELVVAGYAWPKAKKRVR